jgi:hypothetical protein
MRWFGTVRARTGVVLDNVLLYVTGGLAYARFNRDFTVLENGPPPVSAVFSSSRTRWGWTAGVGSEWMCPTAKGRSVRSGPDRGASVLYTYAHVACSVAALDIASSDMRLIIAASSMKRLFSTMTHGRFRALMIVVMQSMRTGQPVPHGMSSCWAQDMPMRSANSRIAFALMEFARQSRLRGIRAQRRFSLSQIERSERPPRFE